MAQRGLTGQPDVRRRQRSVVAIAIAGALALGIALVTTDTTTTKPSGSKPSPRIAIVTAENFWGSIASSIGGRFVEVKSIINNPNVDPHSYEPTAADARAFARADIAVVNGVGYDPWATRLLAADTVRHVVNVGSVLGLADGANPHRWYNPSDVTRIVDRLVTVLSAQLPAQHDYFTSQAAQFSSRTLARFHQLSNAIVRQFSNVPVGASESIFAMLAPALHLHLVTPPSFLRAISEGGDVAPNDIATINSEITHRVIWVYVYNRQNATPDIARQLALCHAHAIPIVPITETMQPSTTTFATWQTSELQLLYSALLLAKAQRTHG